MIYRTTVIDFEADEPAQAEIFDSRTRDFLNGATGEQGLGGIKITHVKQGDRTPARAISTMEIEHVADKLLLDRGSFFWQLLMLVPRADPGNLAHIRAAWPWIVEAVERWQSTPNGDVDLSDLVAARK